MDNNSNTKKSESKGLKITPTLIISIFSVMLSCSSLWYTHHSTIVNDNIQHLVISDIKRMDKKKPYVWDLQVNSGAISKITWYSMYEGDITLAKTSDSPQTISVFGKQHNQKYNISDVRLRKDARLNHYTYSFFALVSDFQGNNQLYMLLITGYNDGDKESIPVSQARDLRVEWVDPSKLPLIDSKKPTTAGQAWYIDQIKVYDTVLNQFRKYDLIK